MSSKKKFGFIIIFVILAITVLGCSKLFKDNKADKEKAKEIKEPISANVLMGSKEELKEEKVYQNGNFKLVFAVDKATDKINIFYGNKKVIETNYNHDAKVRVNAYNNLYIIEIYYPMAQCPTLNLFFLSSDGNPIEQSEIINPISRIEYYEDVNKIIVYKEQCMPCEDCNKKYTYELNNHKLKLVKEETKYDRELTKVENDGDYTYYSFNFSDVIGNIDDKYEFNIDEYKFRYVITKTEGLLKYYDLYIDDKKVYSDIIDNGNIKIKTLGKYVIFTNTYTTNIRSTKLYVYDGSTLKEIYELDEAKGMVAQSAKDIIVTKEGILIKGTRINNGPVIMSDDIFYDTYSKDTCSSTLRDLKEDYIVKQNYSYKYSDSVLNFVAEKTNKYTLKEYIRDEEFCNNTVK